MFSNSLTNSFKIWGHFKRIEQMCRFIKNLCLLHIKHENVGELILKLQSIPFQFLIFTWCIIEVHVGDVFYFQVWESTERRDIYWQSEGLL